MPGEARPDPDWYVPYRFTPWYCLEKNLVQFEMKIFLETLERRIEHPQLRMLPAGYDYAFDKREKSDPDYFSVKWAKGGPLIPMAADEILSSVGAKVATG